MATIMENVQRRASKRIPGLGKMSYKRRLKKLKMPSVAYRRLRGDVIEVYKMVNNLYDKGINNLIQRYDTVTTNPGRTRGHKDKIYVKKPNTELRKNTFLCRVVDIWNCSSAQVVASKTLNTFKNRLDKHWSKQKLIYNYKEVLTLMKVRRDYEGPVGSEDDANYQTDAQSSWSENSD